MSDTMTEEIEATPIPSFIILDDQLIDHLCMPESSLVLFRERFSADLLLKDEQLAKDILQFVFDFIADHGDAPSSAVVRDKFPKFTFSAPECPIDYLIEKFRNRYKRNKIEPTLREMAKLSSSAPDEALNSGLSSLYDIAAKTQNRKYILDTDDWEMAMERYKNKIKEGRFNGVTLGYEQVDDLLGGLRPGTITYILARPKRYKSWALLKSAVEAQWQGNNVYFSTMELSHDEMYGRYMCLVSNVSWNRYSHGVLMPEEHKQIAEGMTQMQEEGGKLTMVHPAYGERNAPMMLESAKRSEANIMYLDQMSYMEMAGHQRWDKDYEKVKYICHELKRASDTIPIYIAAQFNREAANLKEMGDLSQIGLSDAIGQTADLLLGHYQSKEMRQSHMLEFGVVDSRNTPLASYYINVQLTDNCNFEFIEEKVD